MHFSMTEKIRGEGDIIIVLVFFPWNATIQMEFSVHWVGVGILPLINNNQATTATMTSFVFPPSNTIINYSAATHLSSCFISPLYTSLLYEETIIIIMAAFCFF